MEHGVVPELRIYPTPAATTVALARHLYDTAVDSVAARDRFTWVLAGGRTPERLYDRLARDPRGRFPWERTEVYFGDERCVSPRSSESNFAMARASFAASWGATSGRRG